MPVWGEEEFGGNGLDMLARATHIASAGGQMPIGAPAAAAGDQALADHGATPADRHR